MQRCICNINLGSSIFMHEAMVRVWNFQASLKRKSQIHKNGQNQDICNSFSKKFQLNHSLKKTK